MVTTDTSPNQSTASSAEQTQNPQNTTPASLQPNQPGSGLQNVVSSQNLFNTPEPKAVITLSNLNGQTTQSLLVGEADNSVRNSSSSSNLAVILGVAVIAIAIGSYLIMKKLPWAD